jgi:CDP-paratose 2-epimerase
VRYGSVLITGGAGFVGSHLAAALKQRSPQTRVVALDNLSRRGSELNVPRLLERGVEFRHGDIRCYEDLERIESFDLLIDCSAEPSVQAGASSSPRYVLNTNLAGTMNCLEAARLHGAAFLFLSTSRVYPLTALNQLPYIETETRFELQDADEPAGFSAAGIAEAFPLHGARSFYGATKLSSELLIAEYVHSYGLKALINRCGVLAGPWQMGKVDQGVITLWVARHHFGRPLRYLGFDGLGKQVRDALHIEDLCDLVWKQLQSARGWNGEVFNVGGGRDVSTSLRELTVLCRQVTGQRPEIDSVKDTGNLDVRIYLTDASRVREAFDWQPRRSMEQVVGDIHQWIAAHEKTLHSVLAS